MVPIVVQLSVKSTTTPTIRIPQQHYTEPSCASKREQKFIYIFENLRSPIKSYLFAHSPRYNNIYVEKIFTAIAYFMFFDGKPFLGAPFIRRRATCDKW